VPGQYLLHLAAFAFGAVIYSPSPLPIRVPVWAVAANDAAALALTDDDVRLIDASGFPVRRFARESKPSRASLRRQARAGTGFPAAGVMDDGDFNDPHDPDSEIEDADNILVGDPPPAHRRAGVMAANAAVSLAAGRDSLWVGRADGLWRLSAEGRAERVALPAAGPVRRLTAGAEGRVIVAALDGGVVRSDDGGARFHLLAEAPGAVTSLAVTGSGHAYALTGEGVVRLESGSPPQLVSRGGGDLTACGNDALALVERWLVVVSRADRSPADERAKDQRDPERTIAPPGVERLACSPDGTTWVAFGAALWVSDDRGHNWTARDDLGSAFPIAAVAVGPAALWVAGPGGLALLPLRAPSPSPACGAARPFRGPTVRADAADHGLPAGHSPWWLAALPRLDLDLTTARSSTRHEVRAFVLLSFTFDPRRDSGAERRLEALARAAERRASAQRALEGTVPGGGELDRIATEERDAVARLLD